MTDFDIFLKAPLDASDREMVEYLDRACEGDADLRARVVALLEADGRPGEFMSQLPVSPTDPSDLDGSVIGNYKLLEKIGEGGFGVVYMTDQLAPVKRRVALKIIKLGMDTKQVVARFEAERQALAMMDHPNIAKLHDAGVTETGRPYFVMELVKGVPLTEFCDLNKLSNRRRLELFVTVCRAVQHAHQKGVIHRDLKPRNVLVTLHDNKPVPKIIDFGVAKAIGQPLTEKTMFTSHGQMIGTPTYMSPEQAQMSGLDVDTRSDVYSLGVLLYELLTGSPPLDSQRVRSSAYAEVQRLIAEEEALKPSTRLTTLGKEQAIIAQQRDTDPKHLQQYVRGDLDWIVMKALEKDRSRRYATADNFAEDVERFLNDDEVHARPPSTTYRFGKFARKHRTLLLGIGAVATALLLGTAMSVRYALEARDAKEAEKAERLNAEKALVIAESESNRADAEAKLKRRQLYASNLQLADQLWNSLEGNQRDIEALLAEWIPIDDSEEDLREFAWRCQWSRLHESAETMVLEASQATISVNNHLITADSRGLREWLEDGRGVELWLGDASNAVLSPDGKRAALPGTDHFQLYDLETRQSVRQLPGKHSAFSADGAFILTWDRDSSQTWHASTGELAYTHDQHGELIRSRSGKLQLSPDGQSVLLKGHPHFARVTACLIDQPKPVTWPHRNSVHSTGWSRDGRLMASGDFSGQVYLYDTANPNLADRISFSSYGKTIRVIEFNVACDRLATGGGDGTIDLWDVSGALQQEKPRHLRTIKAHGAKVESLTFSQSGTKLASVDSDNVTKLWDLTDDDRDSDSHQVNAMHENTYGAWFPFDVEWTIFRIKAFHPQASPEELTGVDIGDHVIGMIDSESGELVEFKNHTLGESVERLLGPPGSRMTLQIASASGKRHLISVNRVQWLDSRPARVAYAPDGSSLAIADMALGATRWSPSGAEPTRRFPVLGVSLAYRPDGRYLAIGSSQEVLLWDLLEDRLHHRWDGEVQPKPAKGNEVLGSVAYSPDGRYVAWGTGYPFATWVPRSDLKVWDVETLEEIGGEPLFKNDSCLTSVVFTPDGQLLVAADQSGKIRLWQTRDWQLAGEFDTTRKLWAITVSSDGTTLAAGGESGVSFWDLKSGTLKTQAPNSHSAMSLAYSPDGRTLASGGRNNTVRLWDTSTGRSLQTMHAHTDLVYGTAFSPDGNTLATVGTGGFLHLWKAASIEAIDRHPLTLRSMVSLAESHLSARRYDEAEAILRRVIQKQESILAKDHPDLTRARNMIETALQGQPQPAQTPPSRNP